MTKRITRILDANNTSLNELVSKSNEAMCGLKWVTLNNVVVVREEAEQALAETGTFAERLSDAIAVRSSSDEELSPKRYKRMIKRVIASTIDMEFLEDVKLSIYSAALVARRSLEECRLLGYSTQEPKHTTSQLSGDEYTAHRLEWAKYSNYLRIAALESYGQVAKVLEDTLTVRSLKVILEAILRASVSALRTRNPEEFIVNSIIPILLRETSIPQSFIMFVVQILSDGNVLSLSKTTYTKADGSGGAIDWMVNYKFGDVTELATMRMLTGKQNTIVGAVKHITNSTHMISQRAWRYANMETPDIALTVFNYFAETRYAFRTGTTADERNDAFRTMILDKSQQVDPSYELLPWQRMELIRYELEYQRIMEHGNSFAIGRFLDSANRVYDEAMFGFQKSSAMKGLLRFADSFEYSDEDWDEVRWAATVVYTGKYADNQTKAVAYFNANHEGMLEEYGDDRGYFAAIESGEPTNIIVFLDATTQGTQLYGAVACSAQLLQQGGATAPTDAAFVKAYPQLAAALNWKLAVHQGFDSVREIFNTDNVKSLHMTSLYNSGKQRITEGRSFTDAVEEWEMAIAEEYETSTSKLGKLVPLLKTVREAGLSITGDDIYSLFRQALQELSADALEVLVRVNRLVKEDPLATEIYKWQSIDGVWNQYAMTKSTQQKLEWCTSAGEHHSLTYHDKVLSPGASWRGLAPRWIQALDAYLVRYVGTQGMLVNCPFAVIHDSFGVPASFAKQLRQWYRDGLCNIVDDDPMVSLATDITGHNVSPKFSLQHGRDTTAIKKQIQASVNALMY